MKKRRPIYLYLLFSLLVSCLSCKKNSDVAPDSGAVTLSFKHQVKTAPLSLGTTIYTNAGGELYSLSKFKYYISNIAFVSGTQRTAIANSYFLIDEAGTKDITLPIPIGNYSKIEFLIGVDSARNTSGAQTGALDPLNDMFWTWNSGYIMAKLEGTSPASTVVNNKIEYHIGGFSGINNVLQNISLSPAVGGIPTLNIAKSKTSVVEIGVDIDKWFGNSLSIRTNAVITTPGAGARMVSENYKNMFFIKNIIN